MIFLHRQNENIESDASGFEIDVRSSESGLIITHDKIEYPQKNLNYFTDNIPRFMNKTLIVNVKESGLEEEIMDILNRHNIKHFFLDSQIPDIVRLSRKYKNKFIIRVSDVESYNEELISQSEAEYIWLDYTKFNDFNLGDYMSFIRENTRKNHKYILVSPELYDLRYVYLIEYIMPGINKLNIDFNVCTKHPLLYRK